jgi:hypothetical protein
MIILLLVLILVPLALLIWMFWATMGWWGIGLMIFLWFVVGKVVSKIDSGGSGYTPTDCSGPGYRINSSGTGEELDR